ncbi:MAG: polysaccharide pyruvyl transferase family protein [Bacillota bacterium]
MKKIGILTHYANSTNYGGLLQAYALVRAVNNISSEFNAVQICTQYKTEMGPVYSEDCKNIFKRIKGKTIFEIVNKFHEKIDFVCNSRRFGVLQHDNFEKRIKIFKKFEESIAHFDFNHNTYKMERLNNIFDIFVVGSDQVWNPNWFYAPFYLDFANDDKLKISYAASMGVSSLTEKQQEVIISLVEKFDFISVREQTAKDLLSQYVNKEICTVCDPVLLLSSKEWNQIAESPLQNQKYIYSYLLGDRKENRDIATRISKMCGLPIAAVPFVHMNYNSYDKKFIDIEVNDVGPAEFVGLIRDGSTVVTDSFHCVVFSIIYKKKFIALHRSAGDSKESMNSRLTDLLAELGLSDRIVTDKSQISDEFLCKDIDYDKVHKILDEKKELSKEFLEAALDRI